MSDEEQVGAFGTKAPIEELQSRRVPIAGMGEIARLLPRQKRRTIGAWCFFDHFGPITPGSGLAMEVGPHPHMGLETLTWLFSGEVVHHDSLGNHTLIRPGDVNIMTAGHGIAHAEESPASRPPRLHGIQLWVVLPAEHFEVEPSFAHYVGLATIRSGAFDVTVFAGSLGIARAPYQPFSPLFGAELVARSGAPTDIALDASYEHGVVLINGSVTLNGTTLHEDALVYVPPGADEIEFVAAEGTRLIVFGGPPFPDRFVMWWNLIAPNAPEIAWARVEWMNGTRFGTIRGRADSEFLRPSFHTAPSMLAVRRLTARAKQLTARLAPTRRRAPIDSVCD